MATLTITPERELVIPSSELEAAGLEPGQRVALVPWKGRLELVPVPELAEVRGLFRGMPSDFEREPDRDL